MKHLRKMISYILLFVLGSLMLKNLDLKIGSASVNSCQEFGHIHLFELKKLSHTSEPQKTYDVINSHSDQDLDCHEAKSITGSTNLPAQDFVFVPLHFHWSFKFIFEIPNHFKNQDLEPQRRPPRPVMA